MTIEQKDYVRNYICAPTKDGFGIDISHQKIGGIGRQSLSYIFKQALTRKIEAVELGGGYGGHSIRMAESGANVLMVDLNDMASDKFANAMVMNPNLIGRLKFSKGDFSKITDEDIPDQIDLLFSERAIHYVPHYQAKRLLKICHEKMVSGSMAYISAAGYDTETGLTNFDRHKPVEERFNYISEEMQRKHCIWNKAVIYKEHELADLLRGVGFEVLSSSRSTFGHVSVSAMKP